MFSNCVLLNLMYIWPYNVPLGYIGQVHTRNNFNLYTVKHVLIDTKTYYSSVQIIKMKTYLFQLSTFRKLRSTDGFLTHNVRPIQPLSGRPVWYNIGENISNSNTIRTPLFTVFCTTLILIWNSVLQLACGSSVFVMSIYFCGSKYKLQFHISCYTM